MFIIDQSSSYLWPVTVEIAANGGKFDKQTFDIEFKRISQDEIKELISPKEGDESPTDKSVCQQLIVGWKGIYDQHKQEVPFTDKNLDAVLSIPSVSGSILMSFLKSVQGNKTKN